MAARGPLIMAAFPDPSGSSRRSIRGDDPGVFLASAAANAGRHRWPGEPTPSEGHLVPSGCRLVEGMRADFIRRPKGSFCLWVGLTGGVRGRSTVRERPGRSSSGSTRILRVLRKKVRRGCASDNLSHQPDGGPRSVLRGEAYGRILLGVRAFRGTVMF